MATRICTLLALAALSFSAAQAQNFQGMDQSQMRQMMLQAEKMQQCMAKLDQSKLEALMVQGGEYQKEVKSLCQSGQRDAAMSKAVTYGKEIASAPVMQEMQRCGEMIKEFMPQLPITEQLDKKPGDAGYQHICDVL